MRAGGHEREVRAVCVEHEIVDGGERGEFRFRAAFEFDLGGDVNFIARPSFDGDRAGGCAVDRERAAVAEATRLVARRTARELRRWCRRGRGVRRGSPASLRLRVCAGAKKGKAEQRQKDGTEKSAR